MTIAWMVYGIVVGVLVAIAAQAAQSLGRLAGAPVRWVWAGGMVLTLGFVGLAPYRETASVDPKFTVPVSTLVANSPGTVRWMWSAIPRRVVDAARHALIAPIERGVAVAQRWLPASVDSYLIALWLSLSCLLALAMMTVHIRFRRARCRWPTTILRGVRVRIAPDEGPAVIGLIRPEIIVPRWLLGRSADEQQLVLTHEVEHLRARDPMLLTGACAAALLVPWNPVVWWILARLRLAVELDCDARVLRGGVVPQTYGALLIDLAEQCSGFRVPVPALADDSSHLRQRLIAMKPDTPRFARVRTVAISALALTALLIACETPLPTSDEVRRMDVSSAERVALKSFVFKGGDVAMYTVDGVVVSPSVARATPADTIWSLEILKSVAGKQPQIRISTRKQAEALAALDSARREGRIRAVRVSSADLEHRLATTRQKLQVEGDTTPALRIVNPARKFAGIYMIDGARVDQAAVEALDPKNIVSVEIVKGPAAATLYNDPLAANGLIAVTTRSKHD